MRLQRYLYIHKKERKKTTFSEKIQYTSCYCLLSFLNGDEI